MKDDTQIAQERPAGRRGSPRLAKVTADAVELGRERLNPKLYNPDYLALIGRRKLLSDWLSKVSKGPLHVLDVGGRIQPYRPLLEGRLESYIAVDLQATGLVDALAVGENLPFGNASFDLVLCTGVLGYVDDPARVIAEIHRVLKPDGTLLLSTPGVFLYHADNDRWRFFPDGLRILLSAYSQVEVCPEGYSLSGLCWNIAMYLDFYLTNSMLRKIVGFPVISFLNRIGESCDHWTSPNMALTNAYSAFARK